MDIKIIKKGDILKHLPSEISGFPAFEVRKEFFHLCNGFFLGELLFGVFVELVQILHAMVNHFIHADVCSKSTVLITVAAIFGVHAPVFVGTVMLFT